ncbi:hypothetical protein D3C81_1505360 [compost metagenome]
MAVRVQFAHLVHEALLGGAHVEQGLPRLGLAEEAHEIHRMPRTQGHADLGIVLEAADARAMPGARVEDQVGAPLRVHLHPGRRQDAQQGVVDRALEAAPVQHGLVVEVQQRRLALLQVLQIVVAALAQGVPEQQRALGNVDAVAIPVVVQLPGIDRPGQFLLEGLAHPCREILLSDAAAFLQYLAGLGSDLLAACQPGGDVLILVHVSALCC